MVIKFTFYTITCNRASEDLSQRLMGTIYYTAFLKLKQFEFPLLSSFRCDILMSAISMIFKSQQYTSLLSSLIVSMCLFCPARAVTMTKIVSVGNSVSLDCIDTQERNVAISWTKGNGRNTQSIGYASRSSESALFYKQFNNKRFSLLYTNAPKQHLFYFYNVNKKCNLDGFGSVQM